MKQISMREFQLNAPKYLKELPIELTRYKEVVAIVHLKVSELEPHSIIKVENVQNTGVIEKPEPIVVESKLDTFQKLKKQLENPKEEVVDVSYGQVKYTAPTPPEEPEFTYSKEDI